MGNSLIAVIFVVVLQLLMTITNASLIELNPEQVSYYDCQNSMLSDFSGNGCTENSTITLENTGSDMPTLETDTTSTSLSFTDIFGSVLKWINKVPILGPTLLAPYNLLQRMNLPGIISFSIGMMWYIIVFFVFVSFMWGGRE